MTMTDHDHLEHLLRSALRPALAPAPEPSRDLWPLVVDRIQAPPRWSWVDLGLAAVVTLALLMFPEWLLPLAYHL